MQPHPAGFQAQLLFLVAWDFGRGKKQQVGGYWGVILLFEDLAIDVEAHESRTLDE